MSDYCRTCEKEVGRCWGGDDGMCGGGGHCMDCMGYNFEDLDDVTEEQLEMREATEILNEVIEKQ